MNDAQHVGRTQPPASIQQKVILVLGYPGAPVLDMVDRGDNAYLFRQIAAGEVTQQGALSAGCDKDNLPNFYTIASRLYVVNQIASTAP